jgi:DNA repair photolyase
MITDFIGEFMFHPAPLEFSGNTCSHGCRYCFANLRKSERIIDLKAIIKQCNKKEVKTYQDALIKEGYPICMSNKTDPFSKSNYISTIALGYELNKLKNGLFIQTKGGAGIDEFLKAIEYKKDIVWYITITTLNEAIRKRIEPNAPTSQERFDLAKKLKGLGYLVIIALNPVLEQWMPENDLKIYMQKCKDLNIKHICIEPLHLNKNESSKIKGLTQDEISYALNQKAYSYQNYAKHIIPIVKQNGFHVVKVGNALYSEFFYDIRKVFTHIFPNQYDFINYCHNEIKKGIVTFDEFYKVSVDNKPFFEREFKYVNKYILRSNIHEWAKTKEAKQIYTLKGVLQFIWNNTKIQSSLTRSKAFRIVVDENNNPIFDKKNNLSLYFNKGIYPKPNRTITFKQIQDEN